MAVRSILRSSPRGLPSPATRWRWSSSVRRALWRPVLVEQGKVLAATFHPELSQDRRVHRYFVEMVAVYR